MRDDGSSLIEQVIAMTVIVAVLLGLLGSLGATARALSTGRQRTIAVSLAKQAIERLQGSAYTDVAMNLASPGLTSDPLVGIVSSSLTFEGEKLVAGSATPYRTTVVEAGTTFTLRSFVTAVTPASGTAYRRVTLIIGWNPTASGTDQRSMRFSSLIFPLDYTSYPSSNGAAEATGGLVTVTGTLDGDLIDEMRLELPGTHATTDSSTLRTAIGTAASATSAVDVQTGVVASTCPAYGDGSGRQCSRVTAASVADNDSGTNTGGAASAVSQVFTAASSSTPGGTTVWTPAGTMTSRAIGGECGSCGFADSDDLPWSEASLETTSPTSLTFQIDGTLGGTLWELASGWAPVAQTDHDADGGGVVRAAAQITVPAVRVFDLAPGQAPVGFQGAVRLSGFTASASVNGGYTAAAPAAASTIASVQLWDGSGYQAVNITPGTSADVFALATFDVGARTVKIDSRVQAQPTTTSTTGSGPHTSGVAQHTSLLLVTVAVTVTTGGVDEKFTIVFDFGRVSARTTWLVEPA